MLQGNGIKLISSNQKRAGSRKNVQLSLRHERT